MTPGFNAIEIAPERSRSKSGPLAGQIAPAKARDADIRAFWRDRAAAGRKDRSRSLLVNHDESSSLFPRAYAAGLFGSVSTAFNPGVMA